jgi:hypothetical protein
MRVLATAALGLGTLVLCACYQSDSPLGPPDRGTIDRGLVGTWTCVDPKDASNTATVTAVAFDAHQYFVEWREAPDHVTRYRAWSTPIDGHTLLNVQELDGPPLGRRAAFLRVRGEAGGRVSMAVVDADALKGLKGEAALQAIRRRVADPSLYGPFATCARRSPEAP